MREQRVNDQVKVRGTLYTIANIGPHPVPGEGGHAFTLADDHGNLFTAFGRRVMHNSRLLADEGNHAPAAGVEAVPAPAPVETCQNTEHATGRPGCLKVDCDGIPPVDAPAEVDRLTVRPVETGYETGPETFGRALAVSLRIRLRTEDVTLPTWGGSRDQSRPGHDRVRDYGVHTLTAQGRKITVITYNSRSAMAHTRAYCAVYVDGFLCEHGREINAHRAPAEVAHEIGYAIMRLVELITVDPDQATGPNVFNTIPAGATLRPVRLVDLRPGDIVRSFVDFVPHFRVSERPMLGMYGRVEVPMNTIDNEGRGSVHRGKADDTMAVITLPAESGDQGDSPAAESGDYLGELLANVGTAPATDDQAPAAEVDQVPASVIAFTVKRATLAEALAYVTKIVPKRAAVPVLGGVLFTADAPGNLRVDMYDYEQSRTVDLTLSVCGPVVPGRALIPGKLLADIVKDVPKDVDAVTITVTGGMAGIVAGTDSFDLETMPVDDYPTLPATPALSGVVDVHTFTAAAARVATAAGIDATMPAMTGLRLTVQGDTLALWATDRYRATTEEITWTGVDGVTSSTALPPAAALVDAVNVFTREARRMPRNSAGNVEVSFGYGMYGDSAIVPASGASAITLAYGAYTLTTRCIDGPPAPIPSLFLSSYAAAATVDSKALSAAVARASKTLDRGAPVILTFAATGVTVSAGGSRVPVPGTFDGTDGFTIGLNPKYLRAGLATLPGAVTFGFADSNRPVILRASGLDAYGHLIMPIRIGDSVPAGAGTAVKGPIMTVKPTTGAVPFARNAATDQATPATDQAPAAEGDAPAARPGDDPGDRVPAKTLRSLRAWLTGQGTTGHKVSSRGLVITIKGACPDAAEVSRIAGRAYVLTGKETPAFGGFYARYAPAESVDQADAPAEVEADAPAAEVDQAPAAAPAEVESTPAAEVAPAAAPVEGQAVILVGVSGVMLTGTPRAKGFALSRLLNARRGGLGWTFSKDAATGGAWVLNDSSGAEVDATLSGKIRACVDALATVDITPAVLVAGYDADAAPVVPDAVEVDPATLRDILSRVTWSADSIKARGAGRGAARVSVDIMHLPGRVSPDVFRAINDVVKGLSGAWSKAHNGFRFAASELRWNGTAQGTRTPGGADVIREWLARNDAPAAATVDAPAEVDQAPAAEVAPAAPTGEAPVNPFRLVDGEHVTVNGTDGHGAPLTVTGYVRHLAGTASKGDRARLSATPTGPARVVYMTDTATVTRVDAGGEQVAEVAGNLAPGTPVTVTTPVGPTNVIRMGTTRQSVGVTAGTVVGPVAYEPGMVRVRDDSTGQVSRVLTEYVSAAPLTTEAIVPPATLAPADAAALDTAAAVARVALTTPAAPAAVPASASGALTFNLATYSAEVNHGEGYRASRKRVHAALRAAGVAARVNAIEGSRRAFTVTVDAGATVDQVTAIVAATVALDATPALVG